MIIAFYDGIPEVVSTRSRNTLAKYEWHKFLSNSKFKLSRQEIFESYNKGYFGDENGFELRIFEDRLIDPPGNDDHIYDRFDDHLTPQEHYEINNEFNTKAFEGSQNKIPLWVADHIEIGNIAKWLSKQNYIIFGYDGNIAGSFVNATKLTYEQIVKDKLWDDQHNVEIDEEGQINGQLENGWFTAYPIEKLKEI